MIDTYEVQSAFIRKGTMVAAYPKLISEIGRRLFNCISDH
jgi:hypothetical protein